MDDASLGRRRRRARPRLADSHRRYPRAGRTLRHAAAAARTRGCDACLASGGASEEHGHVMELRPGYKQTEAGVIPDDWEVSTVGNEFCVQLGKMLDADKNIGVSKPYLGN